jgi:hypothetical protein
MLPWSSLFLLPSIISLSLFSLRLKKIELAFPPLFFKKEKKKKNAESVKLVTGFLIYVASFFV